jgi:hypothetical protein
MLIVEQALEPAAELGWRREYSAERATVAVDAQVERGEMSVRTSQDRNGKLTLGVGGLVLPADAEHVVRLLEALQRGHRTLLIPVPQRGRLRPTPEPLGTGRQCLRARAWPAVGTVVEVDLGARTSSRVRDRGNG